MKRRQFLQRTGALLGASLAFPAVVRADLKSARVLVVGAGYGGATAAKYLRLWSEGNANVTLIEPELSFVSCPLSNLVLGGSSTLPELTVSYDALQKQHGVSLVRDWVTAIDPLKKLVQLHAGTTLNYDKLVLSPGIGLMMNSIEGLVQANQLGATLQAWKAGPETLALQKQLQDMPDGGVFALSIPEAPFRCPPGPYERACQVAAYFKKHKPKSKVLILDANEDVVSKPGLFKKAWADLYPGMIEYRASHNLVRVEGATKMLRFDIQDSVQADVLNVLPRMRAAELIVQAGLANSNKRWAQVNFLNFESTAAKDIHILGDSTQNAAFMPKSAHMANQHAKVAAAAIVAELRGFALNPQPVLNNTCYSFVDATKVVHVASVHQYSASDKTYKTVAGSGGVSAAPSELEGVYAWGWARNIWADSLL
ncbi:MAG: NAD(P)/FAD-dependent oxidoreductase [Candidatus Methylopumilus sp.]|nr:NAD(P)/FAD-dependent oxidoreductase [Candidatus Methylopumilus sp.]